MDRMGPRVTRPKVTRIDVISARVALGGVNSEKQDKYNW